jgi:hypothetical protein
VVSYTIQISILKFWKQSSILLSSLLNSYCPILNIPFRSWILTCEGQDITNPINASLQRPKYAKVASELLLNLLNFNLNSISLIYSCSRIKHYLPSLAFSLASTTRSSVCNNIKWKNFFLPLIWPDLIWALCVTISQHWGVLILYGTKKQVSIKVSKFLVLIFVPKMCQKIDEVEGEKNNNKTNLVSLSLSLRTYCWLHGLERVNPYIVTLYYRFWNK